MNKFSQLLCISVALFVSGCQNKQNSDQWDNACLDPGLPKNIIYHELDQKGEIFSFYEKHDKSKRTSNVSYFSYGIHEKRDTSGTTYNNCRAYYSGSDTLLINIGINGPFGGQGLLIKYVNKKFNTEAYMHTDLVIEGEMAPNQKIIYQKLSLNKENYEIGDSLFGKIEFKSIDLDYSGDTILRSGHGNFRALVKEQKKLKY
ncbi:hypothetical protein [Pedobacter miscanthi]|uniref:Lipoprotein n=1 Tax=Pedobacter miscanthi TaxID=2259170 RepID=A0A366LBW0_9SPHI|nr:hypothetical protein [Pedobacter miscanthi]RBQ11371.1 hypothetical protein DRW42_02585 [Pedobacter miscanthi]